MEISDKRAIVTGGASGLGAATAKWLARCGADVGIFDIDEEKGAEVALDCGGQFFSVDVAKQAEVDAGFCSFIDVFGHPHILVNCAGVAPAIRTLRANREPYPFEAFEYTIDANLNGTAYMSICFAYLCEINRENEENGVIINTASVAAFDGQMGHIAYSASKAGIVGMTLPMARDLAGARIRVVTIAPGLFETPMMKDIPGQDRFDLCSQVPHPARMGHPEEFAMLVEHIVRNSMLNGEVIRLDGALRLAPF